MSINLTWTSNDCSVLVLEIRDEIGWAAYDRAMEYAWAAIAGVPHTVDFISWRRGKMPYRDAFAHFKRALYNQPTNVGNFYVVNEDDYLQTLTQTFVRSHHHLGAQAIFVDSVDTALHDIQSRRAATA